MMVAEQSPQDPVQEAQAPDLGEAGAQAPVAEAAPARGPTPTMRWFAVHTYSSFENKVKQAIEHRATLEGRREQIHAVVIPTEAVIEIKGGKKRTVTRNLMPGYVLVQMEPEEELFNLVKDIKGVSGFVSDGHAPSPLAPEEVANLMNLMEQKTEKPKPKVLFHKGDQIKVVEGPFTNFVGSVEGLDEEKGKLKVMVSIFGRLTPVDLDVLQVEPA
jgi:transcriptional antiterminator NusG